jgi:hypothetical protein
MIYNIENSQYETYITILYISKPITKIKGALYIKISVITSIGSLVVFITILIMPIYPILNSQTKNAYLERFH